VKFDGTLWRYPGQQTDLEGKRDHRSKSHQRCASSEKLNKKGFFIKKQVPVNETKVTINHSVYSGLKSGPIGGTAFLDLVYFEETLDLASSYSAVAKPRNVAKLSNTTFSQYIWPKREESGRSKGNLRIARGV
jgi:hypothetical protein